MPDTRQLLVRVLAPLVLVLPIAGAGAQDPPRRLELADSARNAPRQNAPRLNALAAEPRSEPARSLPAMPAVWRGTGALRKSFVRDQAVLGLLVYGPSFASTVSGDPVSWAATYLVVGGGTYFAAAQLANDMMITEPTSWLATQSALRGGLAGWALSHAGAGNRHNRAASVFFGSIAGTAAALATGRGMSDGEVASSIFGADLAALAGLAATHVADGRATGRLRAGATAIAGLLGYPLGYWYASRASYRVTPGDVTTLWTSAAIGATAAGALVANGDPSAGAVAVVLTAGAFAGTLAGDRWLVRTLDHSPQDGRLVALGALGGGLMGAGVGVLSGAAHDRVSAATAVLTAAGAVGGVFWTEHYLALRPAAARALSGLAFDPVGALAAAAGQPGTHPLLRWTF